MKSHHITSFLLGTLLMALASAAMTLPAFAYQDTIKRSFDVREGGLLTIDMDRGTVEIETSGSDQVHVVMERDVHGIGDEDLKEYLEGHHYNIARDRSGVVVESRFDDQDGRRSRRYRRHTNLRIDVTVIVPHNYSVDFKTGAGDVTIVENGRLTGRIQGRTGAGNIVVGRIEGPVALVTGTGNVSVRGAQGRVAVSTGAGSITLDNILGQVQAATGAGDITATISDQPSEDSSLEAGAGNVTVYMDRRIAVNVDAHASVGSANCDFDLEVRGKWISKSFEGPLNGGGPELSIRSSVGNVTLRRL